MPKFLEDKLKQRYGAKSDIPYKIMNKLGFMKGNKETAKGAAAESKHEAKEKSTSNSDVKNKIRDKMHSLMKGK